MMNSIIHERVLLFRDLPLFDEDWLFQPVPLRQRLLAFVVVLLFVVACVPLSAILVFSWMLQLVVPKTPFWQSTQATVLATLCLLSEVVWFGALIYWSGNCIALYLG